MSKLKIYGARVWRYTRDARVCDGATRQRRTRTSATALIEFGISISAPAARTVEGGVGAAGFDCRHCFSKPQQQPFSRTESALCSACATRFSNSHNECLQRKTARKIELKHVQNCIHNDSQKSTPYTRASIKKMTAPPRFNQGTVDKSVSATVDTVSAGRELRSSDHEFR